MPGPPKTPVFCGVDDAKWSRMGIWQQSSPRTFAKTIDVFGEVFVHKKSLLLKVVNIRGVSNLFDILKLTFIFLKVKTNVLDQIRS